MLIHYLQLIIIIIKNNQQLGWHFDNAAFAITLMIQSADSGGEFEYVSKGRDFDKKFIDKSFILKIINKLITKENQCLRRYISSFLWKKLSSQSNTRYF